MTEPWIDVERAAKHLCVNRETVYRWVESKGLPVHKISERTFRFKISEIDEWVHQRDTQVPHLPRILVVDDDRIDLSSVERSLKDHYEVAATSSPKKALTILEEQPYDILITDLKMQEMSGIKLLKAVKKINPSVVVIVITGTGDQEKIMLAFQEGAYDFLDKKFLPRNILRTVERTWKSLQTEAENRKLITELKRRNEELKSQLQEIV